MNIRTASTLVLVILLVILFCVYVKNGSDEYSLATNHRVVCADITSIVYLKGLYQINYEFELAEKRYKMTSACSAETNNKSKNGMSKILVVYRIDDPSINRPLEDFSSFTKFNIVTTDTVNVSCE